MKEKIVVTGIGLITPLGDGREKTWHSLVEGGSGITPCEGLPVSAAGIIQDVPGADTVPRPAVLARRAAEEALQDAEISIERFDPAHIACTVSSSKPNIGWNDIFSFSQESCGNHIRKQYSITGPGGNYSAACATGLASIKAGMMILMDENADICLAGSAESSLHPLYVSGFKQMGVLADNAGDPAEAIRPFSPDRTGFLPGEGAGVFVLEKESSARKRGVRIYGSIASCVLGNDAYHPVLFNGNGKYIARVIHEAVDQAGWMQSALSGKGPADWYESCYINAHGTATMLNDRLETSALRHVFGSGNVPACSSTKAGTGHLLGAAGSVETAFALLALRDNMIPPTLNLHEKDPACDLDYTPLYARQKKLDCALSLSYGFGGHIGAIALMD